MLQLHTFGAGFEQLPRFDVSLTTDTADAVLDLAALKTPPGDYLIAFYGSAVAKFSIDKAPPQDTVDIVLSEPIEIRVKSPETK